MELFDRTTNAGHPDQASFDDVATSSDARKPCVSSRTHPECVFLCTGRRLLTSVVPSLPCPRSALHGSCCQQSCPAVNINICIAHVRAVRCRSVLWRYCGHDF